jgi:predicted TIM-barrel fold metal-dependent hydrolase
VRLPLRAPLPGDAIALMRRRIMARRAVVPMLNVPHHHVTQPCVPAIDAHAHLNSVFAGRWRGRSLGRVLDALDRSGVVGLVDLDGGQGEALSAEVARVQQAAPDRIAVFAGVNPASFADDDAFGEIEAQRLRDSVGRGARGLKVWKTLGLHAVDPAGRRIAIDDPRLDPLWAAAADLKVPVLIHVADPPAFFQPLNDRNERRTELRKHPDWHYQPIRSRPDGPGFPSHSELIEQFDRLIARHPATTFIGAHLASTGDDLERLSSMLRLRANLHVDIAARVNELGRQPFSARRFMIEFADRVLLGTDTGPDPRWYPIYYQFLETASEYMNYSIFEPPPQGDWRVYGLDLPRDVLAKVYRDNAARLIRFGAR